MRRSNSGTRAVVGAITAFSVLGAILLGTRNTNREAEESERTDDHAAAADRNTASSVAGSAALGGHDRKDGASERRGVDDSVVIRVLGNGIPQRGAEIVAVSWEDNWSARVRRPNGVSLAEIESRANRLICDANGVASIPASGATIGVAARARGFAPSAKMVRPGEFTVEFHLEPGFEIELCGLNHSNERVPDVTFEARFDAQHALSLDQDVEIEKLVVLPLFRSTARSGADAVGTIRDLSPGPYRVIARHPTYAESIGWGLMVPMPTTPYFLSLEPRAIVDGFVRRKSDGRPIEGARIDIRHFVGTNYFGNSCDAVTGADGYFVCDNAWGSQLGDLDGRAICWKDGFGLQVIPVGFLEPGERKRLDFQLEEAMQFHGRVEDTRGEPRGGVQVTAGENQLSLETTTSRADGSFTLHTLTRDYAFHFYVTGSGIATSYPTVPSPWPSDWPFLIRVEPIYTVEGRLVSDAYPIPSARVRAALEVNRVSRLHETWVDADPATGAFRFESLPPGRYLFDVIAKGYSPTRVREVTVGQGSNPDSIEIRLSKGTRVRGFVRTAVSRVPIEGARVGLADLGEVSKGYFYGTLDLGVTTDAQGRFEIESVERGRNVVLSIEKDGFARTLDRFTIDEAASLVERTIELIEGGRLVVTALRPDGRPSGDFYVTAIDPSGSEHRAFGSTNATLSGLSPSNHTVTVCIRDAIDDFRGTVRVYQNVSIRTGEETTLLASFAEGLVIRGTILGEAARRYPGGFAAFAKSKQGNQWVAEQYCEVRRTDLGFAIYGVAPGTYKVQVESIDRQPMLAAARIVELTADSPCSLEFEFGDFVLEGTVTDNTRRPVVGASLALSADEITNDGAAGDSNSAAVATATSASDGRYAVAGLGPGPYRVRIDAEGFARLGSRIVVEDREPTARHDFALEPECRLRVSVVDRGGHGIVARAVTVRDAVSPHHGDEYDASAVDSDGLTIVHGAGTGRYALAVTAPGFFPHRSTIACVAGAPLDVRVTMRRLASLRLVARDALGAPLKRASFSIADLETGEDVSAWIADGLLSTSPDATSTDESGALHIDGIPEGRYRVLGYGIDGEVETSFDPDAKPTTLAAIR